MVSTLFLNSDEDDYDDFVSTRRSIGAHLIKVWIITRYFWDALATTVYNPRQLRGGGGELIEPKYYEGGHCQSVLRSHRFFYIHPLMSWRWHRHLTGSCEPQDNTLPCVWWGNPLTPNKHCHRGSAHPGRTEVIDLLRFSYHRMCHVKSPLTLQHFMRTFHES